MNGTKARTMRRNNDKTISFYRLDAVAEQRRPGITALFRNIKGKNPKWNFDRCLHEAKLVWHKRQRAGARK